MKRFWGNRMEKLIAILIAAVVTNASCAMSNDMGGGDFQQNVNTDSLSGKTVAFVGDSISYGTNYLGGYGKLIQEQQGMIVTNPSRGGAAIARNVKWSADSDGYRPCLIDMVDSLDGEYDYIIIEGGINDFWNHTPIGELTAGFDGGYDETTLAGSMEGMFARLKTEHSESKTGFVIMHDPFTYDAEGDFAPYYEMMKSACEKWNVPCLDLYAQNNQHNGVNVRDAEMKKLYFESDDRPEGDGTHPNELGYQVMYVNPMVEWMKSI